MQNLEPQMEQLKLVVPLAPLAEALGYTNAHAAYHLHKLGLTPIMWYGKKLWSYKAAVALAQRAGHIDPHACIQAIWVKYKM
jgi:hypothetical protein